MESGHHHVRTSTSFYERYAIIHLAIALTQEIAWNVKYHHDNEETCVEGCQAKLDLCFKFSSTNTQSRKYYYTVVKLTERTDVQMLNLWMKRAAKV